MEIPVRCFSCGKVIGHLWQPFKEKVEEGEDPGEALDQLHIHKQCCRRMLLSHLELIDKIIPYELKITPKPKEPTKAEE
ncbi:MAG: DNA-directed RNA polymerase subunit N [Candidatus Korarchaeota archaeon]|nr:DNA-directed RNA polymerase subunit N [Candidatus Korarchaeota archaeon]NIU82003.1 DNA-directed RNA polymerase subunit N [Candidatus Thorarchaeota archaeon]NIW15171.1 DNA-directed RNA polymerase subunit N [Candidatus Thorarchaeota archaeon]NIW53161.1 DNA-directed RNA polymerase subunit N [Candidatus Korarchaeota archaeon]